jgi:hypothetical protein
MNRRGSHLDIVFDAKPKKASLTIDFDLASLVRRIASVEGRGRDVNALVADMVRVYVKETHPKWELVERAASVGLAAPRKDDK